MSTELHVGVDPGKNGQICGLMWHEGKLSLVKSIKIQTPLEMLEKIEEISSIRVYEDIKFIFEKTFSSPVMGATQNFQMGEWKAVTDIAIKMLHQEGIKAASMKCFAWRKIIGIPGSEKDKKSVAITKCRRLVGLSTKNHNIAEACLMAVVAGSHNYG